MNMHSFRLSIEELAFAMGMLGGADDAKNFLGTILGNRSKDELEGRLLAAGHALISRDLLGFEAESQKKSLDDTLTDVILVLLQSKFSIRCSRTEKGLERIVNYFFKGDTIIEHSIENGVVSCLTSLKGTDEVILQSLSFFDLASEAVSKEKPSSSGEILISELEKLKTVTESTSKPTINRLKKSGLSGEIADRVVRDSLHAVLRGSIIKIANISGQVVSEAGFLLLKGQDQYWAFEIIQQDPPLARVFLGNVQPCRFLLQGLMS